LGNTNWKELRQVFHENASIRDDSWQWAIDILSLAVISFILSHIEFQHQFNNNNGWSPIILRCFKTVQQRA
jgi:hypothetical protein